jgi:glutamyl-tRNA synthetase
MEMRKNGLEAEAILNVLAKIGLSYYDDTFKTKAELIKEFNIKFFNKAQIYFDFTLLEIFNKKCLASKEFDEVKHRLKPNITISFFNSIKENTSFLQDIDEWYERLHNPHLSFKEILSTEDKNFTKQIPALISHLQDFNWQNILTILKNHFPEKRGKALFLPIRLALTGKDSGPEMQFIISEIGLELFKKRLT